MIINPYSFVSYDADAQAFITAASITDNTQKQSINTLVLDLKGYGIWTKMRAIYPMIGGTSTTHKWNLKDPRDLNAAFRLVFAGGLTHSASGVLGNGTNGYAETFYEPSTHSTLESEHLSLYCTTNTVVANNPNEIGVYVSNSQATLLGIKNAIFAALNVRINNVAIGPPNADTRGFYVASNITTSLVIYKNSVSLGSGVAGGGTLPTGTMLLFNVKVAGVPFAGGYSDKGLAFASIGDGLNNTEQANFYTAVQAFQTSNFRQV